MFQIKDLFLKYGHRNEAFNFVHDIINTLKAAIESTPSVPELHFALEKIYLELDEMYQNGIGTKRDLDKADEYANLSCEAGIEAFELRNKQAQPTKK